MWSGPCSNLTWCKRLSIEAEPQSCSLHGGPCSCAHPCCCQTATHSSAILSANTHCTSVPPKGQWFGVGGCPIPLTKCSFALMKNMFVPFLHIEYHKSIMILACPAHEIYKYRLELIVVIFHGQILVYHKHFFGPDSLRFTLWSSGLAWGTTASSSSPPSSPTDGSPRGRFLWDLRKEALFFLPFFTLFFLAALLGFFSFPWRGVG